MPPHQSPPISTETKKQDPTRASIPWNCSSSRFFGRPLDLFSFQNLRGVGSNKTPCVVIEYWDIYRVQELVGIPSPRLQGTHHCLPPSQLWTSEQNMILYQNLILYQIHKKKKHTFPYHRLSALWSCWDFCSKTYPSWIGSQHLGSQKSHTTISLWLKTPWIEVTLQLENQKNLRSKITGKEEPMGDPLWHISENLQNESEIELAKHWD